MADLAGTVTAPPEHTPRRPGWLCRDCGQPWPCPDRRDLLRAEFVTDPVAVALYLATCYQTASMDLNHLPVGVLYDRMVGWLRQGRRPE